MAQKVRQVSIGELSLEHVRTYQESLKELKIASDTTSPLLLPDYRFEKALATVQHAKGN
jgi:hypothetical protein